MKKKTQLTLKQTKLLNQKVDLLMKDFNKVLDKHGLSDLQLNEFHFRPRNGDQCTCADGSIGKLVCDRATSRCHCDCI